MIQDDDKQILERDDRLIKALKCVELFVENYGLDNPKSLMSEEYPESMIRIECEIFITLRKISSVR